MKITMEPDSGGVYTSEFAAEHIEEVLQNIKCLLVNLGYHPRTVEQYIDLEDKWFTEKEQMDDYQIASQTEPFDHPFLKTK